MIYLLKVNIALIVLFGFYKLIFSGDTFFHWRRASLLCIYFIAMLVPGIDLAYWISANTEMQSMATSYAANVLPAITITPHQEQGIGWQSIFLWGYAAVVVLLLLRFAAQVISIAQLARECKVEEVGGRRIHRLKANEGPFSFFNWIFVNPEKHTERELAEIMEHEQTHCRQLHSLDILFTELFSILFWLNPFTWLLKREVRLNLEYLADNRVLETGSDSKEYQYHLLGLTYRKNVATISNNFNVLPLKMRIKMMNKKRTKGIGKAKYGLFVPMTAALLVVSNIETVAREIANGVANIPVLSSVTEKMANNGSETVKPESKIIEPVAQSPSDIDKEEVQNEAALSQTETLPNETENAADELASGPKKIYMTTEQMPKFDGNVMQWLAENLNYPAEAEKKNEQGKVVVRFVVNENGKVTDAEIVRSISPSLDKEALRAVLAMPKWKPGMKDNKPVSVYYTLPISFKLTGDKADKNTK